MILRRHLSVMALAFAMAGNTIALENLPATHLAQRGKLLISEDLKQAPADLVADQPLLKMKSGWRMWSGKWVFAEGAMKGTQLASDGRGAVAACVFPFENAIFQFEVRLDDSRQVHFRVQDSIPEHICRVILTTNGFAAQKDDHDHKGPDQPVPFGKVALPIKSTEWKTVLVEILGEAMTVSIDGQQIHGTHPLIATPKAFFDFVVSGGSASFRNLRVWQALPTASRPNTVPVSLHVTDVSGSVVPCRVHLRDATGKPFKPQGLPFWFDHFTCEGDAKLDLPAGAYHYEIERGPEYESEHGDWNVTQDGDNKIDVTVSRIADLARDGWWSGETHVHRPAGLGTRLISVEDLKAEMALHLRAEDLHISPVITWWNQRSFWKNLESPADPMVCVDGNRFFNLMGGEDERGGGALLFFNLRQPLALPMGGPTHPEYPSSMTFLEAAKHMPGAWVDAEKPFWSDAPMWFASGLVDSVGIANNHMNRSGVRDEEAWGHQRDREKFPGVHGNGLWTQEIYYHLLNCGVRLPPSSGSASGVLPNPVGYNRVYVQLDGPLTWEKWWDGLRAGRVFVTNGPLLRVKANGAWPGHVFRETKALHLNLEATLEGRDPMSQIEIIKNGRVLRRVPVGSALGELDFNESGWFLVRVIADVPDTFRFASTGPFYVEIGAMPHRISRKSAQFFVDWMHDRIESLKLEDPTQREEVLKPLRTAEEWWRQKIAAATTDD